jgi:wyosine [tRNA(Phe)-imidazoG37] synthetase (radical SAM superfamily)
MHDIKKLLKSDKTGPVSGFCTVPWTNLTLDENGFLYACDCNGRVKKPIGNILDLDSKEDFSALLENNIMKDSILDNSYRLCNAYSCSPLQDNILLNKKNYIFEDQVDNFSNYKLKEILLQADLSCNLQCPTCRDGIIINKNNAKTNKLKKILQKLEEYVFQDANDIIYIRIVGNGELFASHTMLPWFLNFDFTKYPNIKFDIHTNATLISRYEDYLLKVADKIRRIEVSTDAANSETYKIVRKGGEWNDFLNGMETIKKLKNKNNKISLSNSFVVSALNYKDIPEFIQFAKRYNSFIIFYKVLRWTMSEEKFNNLNIFSPKHSLHNELLNILKTIDFQSNNISTTMFNVKIN